ncbi:MAG TPA: hypothetical protein VLW85_01565 [Myxococcales bacterium]|nr:hypothetical protein [Myxococcales bacterium]
MRLLLLCVCLASAASAADKRLAVLELNAQRLPPADRGSYQPQYFTDLFRQKAVQLLPKLGVITRENLVTLLQSSGRDISQCEGTCAVDTARLIGADYVVAGDFSRVGPAVKLTLTLYDAKTGNVLSGTTAAGRNPEGLDESAQLVADDLFAPLLAEFGGPPPARPLAQQQGSPRAHKLAIGLLIAGGVFAAGSGTFAALAAHNNSTIQNTQQATGAEVDALSDRGRKYNGITIGCLIATGAMLVVGVPLFFATSGGGQ